MSTSKHDWLTPRAELAGLAVLAADPAFHVGAHLAQKKLPPIKESLDAAGLGILAVPAALDLADQYKVTRPMATRIRSYLPSLPKLTPMKKQAEMTTATKAILAAYAVPAAAMAWDTYHGWNHEGHRDAVTKLLRVTKEQGGVDAEAYVKAIDPSIVVIDTLEKLRAAVDTESETWFGKVLSPEERSFALEYFKGFIEGKNAAMIKGKAKEYILCAPISHPDILNHEIGHILDARAGGPSGQKRTPSLRQLLWWPTYNKEVMGAEHEAWKHARETPTKKDTQEHALGTYTTGFHRGRRMTVGLGTALATALLLHAKHADLPLSKEKKEAHTRANSLLTRTDAKKWEDFADDISRKSLVKALESDPRADEKLKKHADSMNRLATGKKVGNVGGYEIRKLRGKEALGCTCPDWRYKRSVAAPGEQECKHIMTWRTHAGKTASVFDAVHHAVSSLSPEHLMALGVLKTHAVHRYGPKIPGLRDLFARHYQAAAHAGLAAGHAGERQLSHLARVPMGLIDPGAMSAYEHAYAAGQTARGAGIPIHKAIPASGGVVLAHPHAAPFAGAAQTIQGHLEAVRSPNLVNRVYRAASGPIQDIGKNLKAPAGADITPSPLVKTLQEKVVDPLKAKAMAGAAALRARLHPPTPVKTP